MMLCFVRNLTGFVVSAWCFLFLFSVILMLQSCISGVWDIKLLTQPARSPDLNHLDLSFFRALDRANSKQPFPTNIDELIENVEQSYLQFEPRTIEKGFVTLGVICNEIIRCGGDNTYKLPHIGKDHILHATGALPLELQASEDVRRIAQEWEAIEERGQEVP